MPTRPILCPPTNAPGVDATAEAAFNEMAQAAAAEGLNIYISSSFRSYEYQDRIYNNYVARDGPGGRRHLLCPAGAFRAPDRPGFRSEHHRRLLCRHAEAAWVAEHAHEYGFIIRYPADKESITGYKYEPWHIRYLGVETAPPTYTRAACAWREYLDITSIYAE